MPIPMLNVRNISSLGTLPWRSISPKIGGSGQVVFVFKIKARHLRCFAADERASGSAASARDAANYFGDGRGSKLSGGEVIEEEQRRRPVDGDVVDAMVHEIRADASMAIH